MQHYPVIISGAGPVGQLLAIALAQQGIKTALIDAHDPAAMAADDGRAYAITSGSWAMLEALGLAGLLLPHSAPVARIVVREGLDGRNLDFDPDDGRDLAHIVPGNILRQSLCDQVARETSVQCYYGHAITHRDMGAHMARVVLADGQRLGGALLVIAEGRDAPSRDALGFAMTQWRYDHAALTGILHSDQPHGGVAHQLLFPQGPFALLPLPDSPDGKPCLSLIWTMPPDDARGLAALGPRGFAAELKRITDGRFGALQPATAVQSYPLGLHQSASMVAPRTALVGDAAHMIHPIAGQGLNLGLRDVAALAQCIVDGARIGLEAGDAQMLARYDRWRAADTGLATMATDGLTRLFGLRGWLPSAVRRAGLDIVGLIPSAKNGFIAEARGESGEIPRLMQGISI